MSEKISAADTYDWFDPLYARAEGDMTQVPWALSGPAPALVDWLAKNQGQGRSAVVVGCGLGDDAEALAAAGFEVTAFDVAGSAISWAKQRFPDSLVTYTAADLFNLPADWLGKFDLVFEFRTLQALPVTVRTEAVEQVAALAKPGGAVLVVTYTRDSDEVPDDGPPWPLSELELAHFEALGLSAIARKRFQKKSSRFGDRARIQYQAPG
ncbi:MAG: SAM-dependent methyltransferase [Leptolyngbya foveolarum]|uniref:SAM-dependent methyltransferase n=1 Tax=Leptolyngbya foveolarum TaxID=47253 RepID=A0A2W4VVR2_9CYAN|nr:MAG: SAM-dependent methyltransferase [Leptolyngbya foveolarum]